MVLGIGFGATRVRLLSSERAVIAGAGEGYSFPRCGAVQRSAGQSIVQGTILPFFETFRISAARMNALPYPTGRRHGELAPTDARRSLDRTRMGYRCVGRKRARAGTDLCF